MPAYLALCQGLTVANARVVAFVGEPGLVGIVAADLVRLSNQELHNETDPDRRAVYQKNRRAARLVLAELLAHASETEGGTDGDQ